MTKSNKICKKLFLIVGFIIILGIGTFGGYFVGNLISSKYFTFNKYENITPDSLRDDVKNINTSGKTPADYSAAIAFQIAEEVMMASNKYEARGTGIIKTSAGVTQYSSTIDKRDGDNFYLGFATYSSLIKTAKQGFYTLGGTIKMQNGTPTDRSVENANWSRNYEEYSWEEYNELFGKYANRNCSYVISTKTVKEDLGMTMDGNLYKFSVILDAPLSAIGYKKQIGNNSGMNPDSVIFNELELTFWLDENFKFKKQVKYESYTVPYGGLSVTLNIDNESIYVIE